MISNRTAALRLQLSGARANARKATSPRAKFVYWRLVLVTRLQLALPWLILVGLLVVLAWIGGWR